MKANRTVIKAIAAAILASTAGLASAAGNTTLNVTATVSAVCKFKTATMTDIALGTIDPSSVGAAVTGTSNINYQCTKGTTPVVSLVSGGTTLTAGANTIPYTFSLGTADAGTGFSAAGTAKVVATASIALAAAQDAAAGSYTDLVTLSINN
jgi:spore coat protein U-like protein